MKRKLLSAFAALAALALASCSMDNTSESDEKNAAYITIGLDEASRTALPAVSGAEDFDRFTLTGTTAAENAVAVNKTWETDDTSTAYAKMTGANIAVSAGASYSFTLTATKGGATWQGTAQKTIESGKNPLSFTLTLNTLSTSGSGSLSVTLSVPNVVVAVDAALKTMDESSPVEVSGTPLSFENSTATYTASNIAAGNYVLVFTLWGDTEKTLKLAEWREYAGITDGVQSISSPKIESAEDLKSILSVSFNTDSDTTFAVKSVTGGSTVTKPADPTKDSTETTSYSFAGWYTSADGSTTLSDTAFDFNTAITADTVLYAKWTESAITYTYTVRHLFQKTDASGYEQNASYPDETKSGTIGAQTQAEAKTVTGFTAQSITQATIAASGTTVEIKYDRKSYTVTFNANGGSTVTSQSVRYGATATKPADPTKTATTTTEYTFADWYSDSGLTTSFSFDTAIKEDITLYAKWTETAVIQAGSISYATTSVSKTTDSTAFTNTLTNTGNGTETYSSSDESVATVNATTGEVTIVGAGTATITATVTDSASYTYATKTASYTLTVTVAVTSVIINNAPSEALFVNSTGTLTATVSPDNATDKTIVWSSSDSDYVSINSETGEYTIMGTKGYGSATITATATNGTEDTSDDVTATCTITGKVTYTSLKAGDVLHTGDTFYTGSTVYFAGNTNVTFPTTAGVITIVEATKDGYNGKFYQFKRSSNGTWPNWSYSVKDNTDGVYITGGSGTSSGDRFTLAVHTKE